MSSSSQPTILEHRDRLNNEEREQREKRQQGEQHELGRLNELEQKGDGSNKKILVVLTSQINLGNTGKETGWYLPELAHPYFVLAPYHSLVFASPEGGVAPCDQKSAEEFKDDEECIKLLRDGKVKYALEHTKKLSDVKASEFDAIIFVGGHGPMFDLPNNKSSQKLIIDRWEQGGVVAAVCHGSCALVNVKLSDSSRFVEGKNIACFTDKEEEEVGLSDVVPFLLESELKKAGARIQTADKWQSKVVKDGHLITGQNPASARDWARQIHETLVSSSSSSSRQQNATGKPVEQQQQQKLQGQESRGGSNEKLQQQPLQGERLPHVALQHHQKTQ